MIETVAIVLHAFDYRETSRIVRLATRDVGVVSALARGARRPKSRFGQGLDLFSRGAAQLVVQPNRDLHTLASFDATHARPGLGGSLRRFGAAAALGEICLRFGTDATAGVHDVLDAGLGRLETAGDAEVAAVALETAWRIVAELGFAPTVDDCALCHRPLAADEDVRFAHRSGGAVCGNCRASAPASRTLPTAARDAIRDWLADRAASIPDVPTARAHQRLLREFLEEHLGEGRAFTAFAAWERLDG